MTLYTVPSRNVNLIRENICMDAFVFIGKNWDYYFTEKVDSACEVIQNCTFSKTFSESTFIDFDEEQNLYLENQI